MSFRDKENAFLKAINDHGIFGQSTQLASFYLSHLDQDNIYSIDLDSRDINVPPLLGVQNDHQSKIIYFSVPRYYNGVDLSKTTAVLQYQTKENVSEKYLYLFPYYDINSFKYYVKYNPISVPKDKEVKYYYEKIPKYALVEPSVIGKDMLTSSFIKDNRYYKKVFDYELVTNYPENGNELYEYYTRTPIFELVDTSKYTTETTKQQFSDELHAGLYYRRSGSSYEIATLEADLIDDYSLAHSKFYKIIKYEYTKIEKLNSIFNFLEANEFENNVIYYEREGSDYVQTSDITKGDKDYYFLNIDLFKKIETNTYIPVSGQEVEETFENNGELFYVQTGEFNYQLSNDDYVISTKTYYSKEVVEDIMILPWSISGLLTKYTGPISFAIKFFILDEIDGESEIIYELNTKIANSKIVKGFDFSIETIGEGNPQLDVQLELTQELYSVLQSIVEGTTNRTAWTDITMVDTTSINPIFGDLTIGADGTINLNWTSINTAANKDYLKNKMVYYVIYRNRVDSGESWERISTKNLSINTISYIDTGAKKLTTGVYQYKIEVINMVGDFYEVIGSTLSDKIIIS